MFYVAWDIFNYFFLQCSFYLYQDVSAKSREKKWANRLAVSTAWSDNSESEEEDEIIDQEYKVWKYHPHLRDFWVG